MTNFSSRGLARSISSRTLNSCNRSLVSLRQRLGDVSRVLSYAQGCLEFAVRPDDIFIVTYPRSGTTLMQQLLHQLTTDGQMNFDHISQVVPWFERSLAVGALSAADLEAMPSPRIFKSHLAYQWSPKGGRTIYITRAGRDVAVSYYHFYCSHLGFRGSFAQFFAAFLKGDVQYKSWFKHTAGWKAHQDDPRILFFDFNDLVTSLPSCIEALIHFCELAVPPQRIPSIIEKCSFHYMKQHEEKFAFTTELLLQLGYQQRSFLRRGQTGEGKATLTPEQEADFVRAAGCTRRFPDLELDLPQFLK